MEGDRLKNQPPLLRKMENMSRQTKKSQKQHESKYGEGKA